MNRTESDNKQIVSNTYHMLKKKYELYMQVDKDTSDLWTIAVT